MISRFTGLLACAKGKHERSMEHAFRGDDGEMYSRCERCGVKMRRLQKRRWVVVGKEDRVIAQQR